MRPKQVSATHLAVGPTAQQHRPFPTLQQNRCHQGQLLLGLLPGTIADIKCYQHVQKSYLSKPN